jgi:E3 ubiquitin-protein ligase RNF14
MSTECGKSGGSKRKKDRLLSPKELLQIPLTRVTVERFVKLKRKKKMEADPTIIYCPRSWCQGAMRSAKYPKITDVTQMDASDSEAEDEVPVKEHSANADKGPQKRNMPCAKTAASPSALSAWRRGMETLSAVSRATRHN